VLRKEEKHLSSIKVIKCLDVVLVKLSWPVAMWAKIRKKYIMPFFRVKIKKYRPTL